MKAKIEALNKTYLVEFKDEDQFVSFLTKHNDDVNNVEIINEESLPELNKPVEVAKPSMSDGWKTLEKSAFVQKEKGVEKKGMTLGGKYAEFKYEPDKTLDASADDKVSEPKNDSPALTGDEPKAANVESTAKENEVKNTTPKTDAPKKEESKEESKKEKSEDKEEVKEAANPDRATKRKLCDIVAENGFDDSEYCFHIFDCMSPESQEKFLRKHNYEDIGYAYDDDRDLAYDLIDAMNSEELAKCKVIIEKWKTEEDEYEDIDESVEEIDVDDEGDEESFQVWIIDRENGNKFSECVSIEYNKEDAIEEAKRVYNESKSNDKVVFVNYSETGETIFSLGAESENKVIESEEDDYDRGYEQGKFDWEAGQFVTYEDRDVKGESDKEDAESEEFWKGYDEGYEDAKTNYNDLDGEEELDDDEEKLNEDTDLNVEYKVTDGEGNEKSFTSLDDLNNFLINDQGLLGEDEYLETEEDFRRFEKSTEDGAELHIEKIDYNSDENNGADMVDNDLNEVMEAAGVETPIKIDEERLKTAKQWVIQNIIKLQYVDRNKITSAKQKNSIVSLLSRAASRAWGIPYKTILNSIIEEKNKKAENIKESVQVGRYKYQTVSDLIAELQQCDPNAVVIVSEKWGRGAAQFAIKQGYTDNKFLEYIGSKEQTEEFPTKAIEISANL